jgi:hypothetical protein
MNIYILLDCASFIDDFTLLRLQHTYPTILRSEKNTNHLILKGGVGINKASLHTPLIFNIKGYRTILQKMKNIVRTFPNGGLAVMRIIAKNYPEHQSIDMFDLLMSIFGQSKMPLSHLNTLIREHWGDIAGVSLDTLLNRPYNMRPKEEKTNSGVQSYLQKMGADIYTLEDI